MAAKKPIIITPQKREDKGLLTDLQKSLREGFKNPKGSFVLRKNRVPPPLPGKKPILKK
jgi:hypothetical protein